MQRAITLTHEGMILRGMEHIPEVGSSEKVPAVILFHGFTGMKLEPHRMFLKISRALEKMGIASFRFDFLGSGESDGDFEDMTVSGELAEANTIFDFVRTDQRIDPDRVSLIGLSMGGLVASVLAGDRPQDVHKLMLLAPAGTMYERIKDMHEAATVSADVKIVDNGGNLVGVQFAEDLKTIDVFNRAKNYQGDVLLIHGTKDEAVPFEVSNLYVERSYGSNATVHFIDGADHTFNKYEWETELIDKICTNALAL
jgi:pimeloyl-ACP methyl ester carboxylesterase